MKRLFLALFLIPLFGFATISYGEDSRQFVQDNDRTYIYDNYGKKKGYIQHNDGYTGGETNIYDMHGNRTGKVGGSNPYIPDKPESPIEQMLRKRQK